MADQWRSMDLGFRGKVAVVTAASWGIGMVVTQTLADEGTHVVAELGIP
jgi:NAD(P)-dependent dehydrogenase (short-subunit alcohol dehydrogenase family)